MKDHQEIKLEYINHLIDLFKSKIYNWEFFHYGPSEEFIESEKILYDIVFMMKKLKDNM